MINYYFDLQLFDDEKTVGGVTIHANGIFTFDGVAYTAGKDEANLKAYVTKVEEDKYVVDQIIGIKSGVVTAKIKDAESSPEINFDGSTPFDFECSVSDGALLVKNSWNSFKYSEGAACYSENSIEISSGTKYETKDGAEFKVDSGSIFIDDFSTQAFKLKQETTLTTSIGEYVLDVVTAHTIKEDSVSFKVLDGKLTLSSNDVGIASLIFKKNDDFVGGFDISNGSMIFDYTTEALTITKGTDFGFMQNDCSFFTTATDVDGTNVVLEDRKLILTPNNGGKCSITVEKLTVENPISTFEVSNGSLIYDAETNKFSMTQGSILDFSIGDYRLTTTATKDSDVGLIITEGKAIFAPKDEKGYLDIDLNNGTESDSNSKIRISGGSIIFDYVTETFTYTKGTTFSFTRSEDSSLSITAVEDDIKASITADGKMSIVQGDAANVIRMTLKQSDGTLLFDKELKISGGAIAFDNKGNLIDISKGTEITLSQNDYESKIKLQSDIQISGEIFDDVIYLHDVQNRDISLNLSALKDGKEIHSQDIIFRGIVSYRNSTNSLALASPYREESIDESAIEFENNGYIVKVNVDDYSPTFIVNLAFNDEGLLELTCPNEKYNKANFEITKDNEKLMDTDVEINGTISFDLTDGTYYLNEGTSIIQSLNGYDVTFTAAGDEKVQIKRLSLEEFNIFMPKGTSISQFVNDYEIIAVTSDDSNNVISFSEDKLILTSSEGANFNIIIRNGEEIISNSNIEVNSGSLILDQTTGNISLTEGSVISQIINGYEVVAIPENDSSANVTLVDGKFKIATNEEDSDLTIVIKKDGEIVNKFEVGSGALIFDPTTESISLTENTTITQTIGDYEITLKVKEGETDSQITYLEDGVKYTSGPDGGGLDISMKMSDGTLIGSSLDVNGAIIFKNDGTIGFENGTVIENTFNNGRIVFTANDGDACSVEFSDDGVVINSDEVGAITTEWTDKYGGVSKNTDLVGTVIYSNNGMILEDGAQFSNTTTLDGEEVTSHYKSEGGRSTISYVFDSGYNFKFEPGDGAKLTINDFKWGREFVIEKGALKYSLEGGLVVESGVVLNGDDPNWDVKEDLPWLRLGDAGTYTLNGMTITTTKDSTPIKLVNHDTIVFNPSTSEINFGNLEFEGDGTVTIKNGEATIGDGVIISNPTESDTFVLTEKGTVTIGSQFFELVEDVSSGVSVSSVENGFIVSAKGVIADKSSEVFTEQLNIYGDDTYTVQIDSHGTKKVIGISDGVSINGKIAQGEDVVGSVDFVTDSTGKFTFGEKVYEVSGGSGVVLNAIYNKSIVVNEVNNLTGTIIGDFNTGISVNGSKSDIIVKGDDVISVTASSNGLEITGLSDKASLTSTGGISRATTDMEGEFVLNDSKKYIISGDDNVTFEFNDKEEIEAISNFDGYLSFEQNDKNDLEIDDIPVVFEGEFSSLSASTSRNGSICFYDVNDGFKLQSDKLDKITLKVKDGTVSVNDNYFKVINDENGVTILDKTITGLDDGASLQVGEAGSYYINQEKFEASAGDVFIGLEDGSATIYDVNNPVISGKTPSDVIASVLTDNFDYGTAITDNSEVSSLINSGSLNKDLALLLENLSADFKNTTGKKNVTLTGGSDQNVTFNSEGKNVAIVNKNAEGQKNITTGSGDVVIVERTSAKVNITTGSGEDSIITKGDDVSIDLAEGKSKIIAFDGSVVMKNYDATKDAGFVTEVDDIAAAVDSGTIKFKDGKILINSATIGFDDNKTSRLVNLFEKDGVMKKVGLARQDDILDLSDQKNDLIVFSDKDGNSTIKTGSGKDKIFASSGSLVDAGTGKNVIELINPEERNENDKGSTIVLSSGTNSIKNFNNVFDSNGDKISLSSEDFEFKFNGENLTIKDGKNTSVLESVIATTSSIESDLGDVNFAKVIGLHPLSEDHDIKIAVAQENSIILTGDDVAEGYHGKNSGVDFAGFDGEIFINLEEGTGTINDEDVGFRGINKLAAGSGNTTLRGSKKSDTLVAGTGNSSLCGENGKDVLIGNSSKDKTGSTEFFFLAGNGKDTIQNFEFLTDDNSSTADKINIYINEVTKAVTDSDGNVVLQINGNNSDKLLIEGAAGKDFKINDLIAKVDDDIEYDDLANCFVASDKNAKVKVKTGGKVWLDGSQGKYFVGDIKTIDASDSNESNELAGNDLDNKITAGSNETSLWGGNGGDDLLVGGEGNDTFYYTLGNGDDTIQKAGANDIVNLAAITLAHIVEVEVEDDSIKISFIDGGTLSVDTNEGTTFKLGDGTAYAYDKTLNTWVSKI